MDRIQKVLEGDDWIEFWNAISIPILAFSDVGLDDTTPDDELWERCQSMGWILITGNRNKLGEDSLEETIRRENQMHSLPVFTIGRPGDVLISSNYVKKIAEKLIDYLLYPENILGNGRLYLP